MFTLSQIKRLLKEFKHLPKSIYFNLHYFPWKEAIKLPVMVCNKVRLHQIKGKIVIEGEIKHRIFSIGFDDIESFWDVEGTIIIKGRVYLSHGLRLSVGPDATLILGNNLILSGRSEIVCFNRIEIGNDCGISWKVIIIDTDFHPIFDENHNKINPDKPIIIGDKNWIGFNAIIMKGTKTAYNTIIGAGSILTKEYIEENTIIAGNPAKVVRRNITWKD